MSSDVTYWTAAVVRHLEQSTIVVLVVWALSRSLRGNRAVTRYWIWFAASVKFLLPLALLVELGTKTTAWIPERGLR